MECQFGLLEDLCRRRVISFQQSAVIRYKSEESADQLQQRSDDNKNMKLIQTMHRVTRLAKFEKFLSALRDNDQQHVAAYIVCDGEVDADDYDRPLTIEELCRLEVNVTFLCDHINTETVINDLHAVNCVNEAHRDYFLNLISIKKPDSDRTKELLLVLQRRSLKSFKRLMEYRGSPATLSAIKATERGWNNEADCKLVKILAA